MDSAEFFLRLITFFAIMFVGIMIGELTKTVEKINQSVSTVDKETK